MTKQEEIKKNLVLYIKAAQAHGHDPEYWAGDILVSQDSQGVVIKRGGCCCEACIGNPMVTTCRGVYSVKSLIEE